MAARLRQHAFLTWGKTHTRKLVEDKTEDEKVNGLNLKHELLGLRRMRRGERKGSETWKGEKRGHFLPPQGEKYVNYRK